jgi:uncharacterized sporulation protein YeaH/YhbH (DUF444 family)
MHTEEAWVVDENAFFHSTESGGTVISSGIDMVNNIIKGEKSNDPLVGQAFPPDEWNIYVVQASDGDNAESDNPVVLEELNKLLPICQYYVYNEVRVRNPYSTTTSAFLKNAALEYTNMALVNLSSVDDVLPTFRKVFSKDESKKA